MSWMEPCNVHNKQTEEKGTPSPSPTRPCRSQTNNCPYGPENAHCDVKKSEYCGWKKPTKNNPKYSTEYARDRRAAVSTWQKMIMKPTLLKKSPICVLNTGWELRMQGVWSQSYQAVMKINETEFTAVLNVFTITALNVFTMTVLNVFTSLSLY